MRLYVYRAHLCHQVPDCNTNVHPRCKLQLTHLVDWQDARDIAYAKVKWDGQGFDLKEAEENAPHYKAEMDKLLQSLADDVLVEGKDGTVSILPYGPTVDDMCLIPDLRTLTVVAGLTWPAKVSSYLKQQTNCVKQAELYDKYSS